MNMCEWTFYLERSGLTPLFSIAAASFYFGGPLDPVATAPGSDTDGAQLISVMMHVHRLNADAAGPRHPRQIHPCAAKKSGS